MLAFCVHQSTSIDVVGIRAYELWKVPAGSGEVRPFAGSTHFALRLATGFARSTCS